MSFIITTLSPKQFKHYGKQARSGVEYYQTAAGTLKALVDELGVYQASFIQENDQQIQGSSALSGVKKLLLVGTDFQLKVWRAALTIPAGKTVSYQDIACAIGCPKAYRAVARAMASNKIAYFIPCHRVVKKSGELCGYNWGVDKKCALLCDENALIVKSNHK